MLFVFVAAVIGGFALLTYGADKFVTGAASVAANLGVSPLLVGLTIVGFATSAPEMLVSGIAAWQGNPMLGIGNAIGSNIANIGLVTGLTALVYPLTVRSSILRKEFPVMLVALGLATLVLSDLQLSRSDGVVLAAGMLGALGVVIYFGLQSTAPDPLNAEFADVAKNPLPMRAAVFWTLTGIIVLLGAARLLVWGAVSIAQAFGVSDLVIGLTIVAVGTSLPELAASVASAAKHEPEIAVGNVIGSNMFNMLGVLCMPGLIRPTGFGVEVLERDVVVMWLLTSAMLVMSFGLRGHGRITRREGALLLLVFLGYQYWLFADA